MAAAQPTYTGFNYPGGFGQPPPAASPVPAAQPAGTDPAAYAQYYAQYAQYAQYAAQYQQYAAAQASAQQAQQPPASHPSAITTPKTVTEVPTYQSNTQKQFQPHTVQISGLDKTKAPNIKDITDKFGTVGTIKKNQYGQASVRCRPDDGLVTVEYEAASSVESAIKWFNDSEIDGCTVKVELAPASSPDVSTVRATTSEPSQEPPPQASAGPGPPVHYQPPGYPPGPHMGPHHPPPFPYGPPPPHFGGPPPPHMQGPPRPNVPPRPGDWDCVHCGNSNFQFRQECRRCKVSRSDAEKGKVSSDKPAAGMGSRPPFRPPFHPAHAFPPRGHPFMRPPQFHPGMRPPFMGGPPRPFFPYRHPRPPYQGAGFKRKQPYSATASVAKEQKTEEKKE